MKEIGELFREKREEIGITTGEIAGDLKVDKIIIDNIEAGNEKVFKDILELKNFIELYSKYLGLDSDEILQKVNDYLFSETSKISIQDIKEAEAKTVIKEKQIHSPYTIDVKEKSRFIVYIFWFLIAVAVLAIIYILLERLLLG